MGNKTFDWDGLSESVTYISSITHRQFWISNQKSIYGVLIIFRLVGITDEQWYCFPFGRDWKLGS